MFIRIDFDIFKIYITTSAMFLFIASFSEPVVSMDQEINWPDGRSLHTSAEFQNPAIDCPESASTSFSERTSLLGNATLPDREELQEASYQICLRKERFIVPIVKLQEMRRKILNSAIRATVIRLARFTFNPDYSTFHTYFGNPHYPTRFGSTDVE